MPEQDALIEALPEPRRSDVRRLHDLVRATVPGLEPTIASGMLGYGRYAYRYESGRTGTAPLVAIASRAAGISLYVASADERGYLPEVYGSRLGRVSCGKSCIRFERVDDLDVDVVREILREAASIGGVSAVG